MCAGAKSILDLGLTLEYLETHGVPVLGYGTKELPAFYSRKSGFEVDYQVDTPAELASIFHASQELGLKGGMLVTNPIPEEYSMDHEVITAPSTRPLPPPTPRHPRQGTTPFLLAKVKELTGGDSLDSNIQLVFNNARLAAQTACELSSCNISPLCRVLRAVFGPGGLFSRKILPPMFLFLNIAAPSVAFGSLRRYNAHENIFPILGEMRRFKWRGSGIFSNLFGRRC